MECDKRYFGESGRGLTIRLKEHQRSYELQAENSVLVKHSLEKDHRIGWKNSKLLFSCNDVGIRRLVEGAAISLGKSMLGNKSFTMEDNFTNRLICNSAIKNFTFENPSYAPLDARAAFSSSLQDSLLQGVADNLERTQEDIHVHVQQDNRHQRPLRRSRRIAGLPLENEGIT